MIEIIRYVPANKNKTIGYVDVLIKPWKFILRRIPHLQSGTRKWFNFPTFSEEQPDGTTKYIPFWEFEVGVHNGEFMEKLEEAVKTYCAANQISGPNPISFDEGMPW